MLTENIDLKVGATNGTIGIITKLEFDLKDNVCNIFVTLNPLYYQSGVQFTSLNHYETLKVK
jgi:hypothetical protein